MERSDYRGSGGCPKIGLVVSDLEAWARVRYAHLVFRNTLAEWRAVAEFPRIPVLPIRLSPSLARRASVAKLLERAIFLNSDGSALVGVFRFHAVL